MKVLSPPHPTENHGRPAPSRSIGIALGSIGALLGLVALPATSQASSLVVSSTRPAPSDASMGAICGGVSASAVSRVVGYTVPAPTAFPLSTKKDKLGISATGVDCIYGLEKTFPEIEKDVDLVYETTNKHVPLSEVQHVLNTTSTSLLKWTVAPYNGLSWPALIATITSQAFSGKEIAGEDGTKLAGAFAAGSIATSKVAGLAELAMSYYF